MGIMVTGCSMKETGINSKGKNQLRSDRKTYRKLKLGNQNCRRIATERWRESHLR